MSDAGSPAYSSRRYDPDQHDVSAFACGESSLDTWLQTQAEPAAARRTARTWVWTDGADRVVGYYALAAHKVDRDVVPRPVGRGGPAQIPALLLARLALDRSLRGRSLGPVLLADALSRVVDATAIVGARLVVVDALHERVAGFYEGFGFSRMPHSMLLVQKVADIEKTFKDVG